MAVEPGLEGEGKDDESDGTSNPYPSDQVSFYTFITRETMLTAPPG